MMKKIPKDIQFIGTYYIYLSRMNTIPRKKIPLAKAILFPSQQPLHSLFNCYHNEHEWSSARAELGWLYEHISQKKARKNKGGLGTSKKESQLWLRQFCKLVDKRLYEGKPIQYILGM